MLAFLFSLRILIVISSFFFNPSDILFVLHWLFGWQWKWGMLPEYLCIANPQAAPSLLPKIAFIGGLCSYLYIHFPFISSLIPCKPSLWMPIRLWVGWDTLLFFSHFSRGNHHCSSSWPLPAAIPVWNHCTGMESSLWQPAGSCPQLSCQETGMYMFQTLLRLSAGKQSQREIWHYSQGEICLPVDQLESALVGYLQCVWIQGFLSFWGTTLGCNSSPSLFL